MRMPCRDRLRVLIRDVQQGLPTALNQSTEDIPVAPSPCAESESVFCLCVFCFNSV